MEQKTVFITGASGYVGSILCRELDRLGWCKAFYGMDINLPRAKYRKGTFRKMDITDPALVDWVDEIKPDILVHLAFILNPIRDEGHMTHINVGGTKNTLAAIEKAKIPQACMISSATAYGAFADNPVPITEKDPIRPHPHFSYARDKAQMEALCAEFMEAHPKVVMSIIRPSIIYGPGVDNYLSYLFTLPVGMVPKNHNTPLQFVHEDDVVGSIIHLLENKGKGPFNVAPSDTMTLRECVSLAGRTILPMPDWVLYRVFDWTWRMKLPIARVPPTFYDYVRYPWVLDNSRLTSEMGYKFLYSTRDTLKSMFLAKNIAWQEGGKA
ncbi:MAG: NAD-dependent epimerase/dehydratase family protein [Desulfatibacillaceae bacterium]|nr:NAD-dependent epimerase/dehydratase family protein [Desulfatibacillaceae bacterium]